MRVDVEKVGYGDRATQRSVNKIRDFVQRGRLHPRIRGLAVDIVRAARVRPNDFRGEVTAIFDFVKSNIRYTLDPVDTELIHSPLLVFRTGAGDCDDMVVLLGSLLESIGHEVKLKIVAHQSDGDFEHVYLLVKVLGEWVPLDASNRQAKPGWEYAAPGREYVFDIFGRRPRRPAELGFPWLVVGLVAAGGLTVGAAVSKDVRKVVGSIGKIAAMGGPFLAVIPGVGQVTAAIVSVAGGTVVRLTSSGTNQVVGYVPVSTGVDSQGNLMLDKDQIAQLGVLPSGGDWWLWLGLAGAAVLVFMPRSKK